MWLESLATWMSADGKGSVLGSGCMNLVCGGQRCHDGEFPLVDVPYYWASMYAENLMILMIRSGHQFAHVTTTVSSGHISCRFSLQ